MSVENMKKQAPAPKRPSCLRERAELREELGGPSVAGVEVRDDAGGSASGIEDVLRCKNAMGGVVLYRGWFSWLIGVEVMVSALTVRRWFSGLSAAGGSSRG